MLDCTRPELRSFKRALSVAEVSILPAGNSTSRCTSPQPSSCRQWMRIVLTGIILLSSALAHAAETKLRIITDDTKQVIAVEAIGLPEAKLVNLSARNLNDGSGLRLLSMHVAQASKPIDQPPMLGTYQVQGAALRFTPKYPLLPGLNYRAAFRPDATLLPVDTVSQANHYLVKEYPGKSIELEVSIPDAPETPAPEIVNVYPTTTVLPENQLKFYVHFSSPMVRGEAYQHLEILKHDGTPVNIPFLELGEELWDRTGQRLTILIDPGRIKRGVKPREDLGPVLEDGSEFTLVIHSDWKDVRGKSLVKSFRKTFRAGPPVGVAIDPAQWVLQSPTIGSTSPLSITFPRPLDHALLERTLTIQSPQGQRILGEISISKGEKVWTFKPDVPWSAGKHQVVVDTVLEDLAGNRIGKAFEVDEVGPIVKNVTVETVSIPFSPM